MALEMTVATFNLWGLNEPWMYTERRGEVRGAVPGSPATTLRVPGGAWTRRRRLVAEALRSAEVDVVGLQEDRRVPGAPGNARHQSEQLAEDLGLAYRAVLPPVDGAESVSGNAVLSRYPITQVDAVPLPASAAEEARHGRGIRDALQVGIETPGGLVRFYVAHLTTRGNAEQVAQAERLAEAVAAREDEGTAIVVGDFNATPDTATITVMSQRAGLRDAWAVANPGDPGHTMLFHTPRDPRETAARFDYVFVGAGPEIVRARLLGTQPDADGFYASDHFGVAVTLRFPG